MKCSRCGYDNPTGLDYCENCSAPLFGSPEGASRPSWNFVKGPQWSDPDFSVDSVSENDIPEDFVPELRLSDHTAADDRRAAARAAAEKARLAYENAAAKRNMEEQRAKDMRAAEELRPKELPDLDEEEDDELQLAEEQFRNEQRRVRQRPVEYDDDYDEDDEPAPRRSRGGSGVASFFTGLFSRKKAPRKNVRSYGDDYGDEDDFESAPVKPRRSGGIASFLSDKKTKTILIRVGALVAVLGILALLIIGIIKISKSCSKSSVVKAPTTEVSPDDDSIYFVTVYAKEGQQLVYRTSDGTEKEVTVPSSGFVKFRVPVSSLMPTEPVDGTEKQVTPQVFIKNDDGSLTPVEGLLPVNIQIPALKIEFNNPDTIVSEDGKVEISGHTDLVATEITVDGESVFVNQDGSFTHTVNFEDTGDYVINVEGRLPGHQIFRHAFNVTVMKAHPTTPLVELPWEYGDNGFSQRVKASAESIEVKGRVPAGSRVTITSDSSNATIGTVNVAADGTYTCTVGMRVPGDYILHISCETEDGRVSTRDMHVQRAPEYATYKNNAHDMNYASFSYASSQAFKLSGTITEILKDDDYVLAVLTISDGKTVVLEYHNHYGSAGTLEVGKTFNGNIYGRPLGLNDEGIPQIYVWFVD